MNDILFPELHNGDLIPADAVLLSTSEPLGTCHIDTHGLDGESNLKIRQCVSLTSRIETDEEIDKLKMSVEYKKERYLYKFIGKATVGGESVSLGPAQLLLRGAGLRNTEWVLAMVIGVGHQTKQLMNAVTPIPPKRSNYDKFVNKLILLMIIAIIAISLLSAFLGTFFRYREETHWYLNKFEHDYAEIFLKYLLQYLVIFHNMVPISMIATLELVRFFQSYFINYDRNISSKSAMNTVVKNSNMSEMLGGVKFIFSDKTGTLTKNKLTFKKSFAFGSVLDIERDDIENASNETKSLLEAISMCHTLIPHKKQDDEIMYFAGSNDEKALVEGAAKLGYVFVDRREDCIETKCHGEQPKTVHVLDIIEYSSERRRMSVIVQFPNKEKKLIMKGADSAVLKRLKENGEAWLGALDCVKEFASAGLRTMCYASRNISDEEYRTWKTFWEEATSSITDRDVKIKEAAKMVECDLIILGVTGVEDELQENVKESVKILLAANMNLWILTGDRHENAVNTVKLAGVIKDSAPFIELIATDEETAIETLEENLKTLQKLNVLESQNEIGLLVNGFSLGFCCLPKTAASFVKLCLACKTVICFRVDPLQKAELIRLVGKETGLTTLAIGDGANDVPMIQTADIGVGLNKDEEDTVDVKGKEASCAADFSIEEFQFLPRLLLVHGSWNSLRVSKLVFYSFYKSAVFYLCIFWHCLASHFSATIVFDRITIPMYNVVFTVTPPLVMSLFDRFCNANFLVESPKIYHYIRSGEHKSLRMFFMWSLVAIYHSLVTYLVPVLIMGDTVQWSSGEASESAVTSSIIFSVLLATVCLKAGLETTAWTFLTVVSIFGSFIIWIAFILLFSLLVRYILPSSLAGVHDYLFTNLNIPFLLILTIVVALGPDIIYKSCARTIFASEHELGIELFNKGDKEDGILSIAEKHLKHSVLINVIRNKRKSCHVEDLSGGFVYSETDKQGVCREEEYVRAYTMSRRRSIRSKRNCQKEKYLNTV